MATLHIQPARSPLFGSVPIVSDAWVALLAVLAAAQAAGTSTLRSVPEVAEVNAGLRFVRALGVPARRDPSTPTTLWIDGKPPSAWTAPGGPIDCGADPRLLVVGSGLLCGRAFRTTLLGAPAADSRVLSELSRVLRARGATIEGQLDAAAPGVLRPPVSVGPMTGAVQGLEHRIGASGGGLKEALLLSGIFAEGPTVLGEPWVGPDHAERLLDSIGVPIERAGSWVSMQPTEERALRPFELCVVGDPSAAAVVLAAGLLVAGSRVTVRGVNLNPTRSGFTEAARRAGARIGFEHHGVEHGEPFGSVTARGGALRGIRLGGELGLRVHGDWPALLALAASARGATTLETGAAAASREWRDLLGAFGVETEVVADALVVHGRGGGPLRAAEVDVEGGPERAMSAVLLALVADGPSVVASADCIVRRFPRFVGTLRALGAPIEVES